jgi:phosphoglycolate phosphatase-like HAD superfamily hydrolase
MKSHVAIDFDGVICDSVDECHITALNACQRMEGGTRWAATIDDLAPEAVQRFRTLRHLARNASEFWLIVQLTYRGSEFGEQDHFDELREYHQDTLARFEPLFFRARDQLRATNPRQWLELHTNYPEFKDGWDELKARSLTFIVTTKDLTSIQLFNEHWGLKLPEDHIWTKERGTDKARAIRYLADATGISPADFLFIDDHPHHVLKVASTGARCFWASWGFLGTYGQFPDPDSRYITINNLAEILPYLN